MPLSHGDDPCSAPGGTWPHGLARLVTFSANEGQVIAMTRDTAPKRIKLAQQGGGAHGAFTWGVLDRLLSDKRLEIEAVLGTSAGAMNAAVLVDGPR